MAKSYQHLSLTERIDLYRMRAEGNSMQAVATALGRSPSTISRELKRNSKPTKAWAGGYQPERAQCLSERRRRWDGRFKLTRQPSLQAFVHERLLGGWSPEQIAGYLRREAGGCILSPESIYRFIYHRSAQKDYWQRLLPRQKSRRGRLGKRGGSPVEHIRDRVPIEQRPAAVATRAKPATSCCLLGTAKRCSSPMSAAPVCGWVAASRTRPPHRLRASCWRNSRGCRRRCAEA